MSRTVTMQAEFDAAVAAGENDIIINSPKGVRIEVAAPSSTYVTARGSSTVTAWDSSTVTARGISTVTARDSSTVTAWDSWTVTACGSSTVTAAFYVAVHMHSSRAKVKGGVVIDVTALDLSDADTYHNYTGGTLLLADDGRRYRLGFRDGHYEAGCRRFTAEQAIEHWSNPDHDAPESAALLLAAVQAHIAACEFDGVSA